MESLLICRILLAKFEFIDLQNLPNAKLLIERNFGMVLSELELGQLFSAALKNIRSNIFA